MNIIAYYLSLFFLGGSAYIVLELIWRGYTHWTMFLAGGLCFILVDLMKITLSNRSFLFHCILSALIILTVEFVFGCIVNIWLSMNVWDYSRLPFNVMGQICLPFFILWFILSAGIIKAHDYIRYLLLGETYSKDLE